MESQRLKQLFELVKQNLINGYTPIQSGICREIKNLYSDFVISIEEKDYLSGYIIANKPTQDNRYAKFMDNPYWLVQVNNNADNYWWEIIYDEKTKQIRVDYLTELINNIK